MPKTAYKAAVKEQQQSWSRNFYPHSVLVLPHGLGEANAVISGYYSSSLLKEMIKNGVHPHYKKKMLLVEKFEGSVKLLGYIY